MAGSAKRQMKQSIINGINVILNSLITVTNAGMIGF
jgi:hypothetical protein